MGPVCEYTSGWMNIGEMCGVGRGGVLRLF